MRTENKNIVGKVECLGSRRDEFEKRLKQQYGEGNWGYGWLVDVLNPVSLDF